MAEKLGEWTKKEMFRLTSVQLTAGDKKVLDYICSFLGVSQSEAVRSSLRNMAMQLSQIEKRIGP